MTTSDRIALEQLLRPDNTPTEYFIGAWQDAGAARELPPGLVVADSDGSPVFGFVTLWRSAWGGGASKSLPLRMPLFENGRFNLFGRGRWKAATGL